MQTHPGDEPPSRMGIKVSDLAKSMGCSKDHIYRLIRDGYLNVFPGPGIKIVTTESLERYRAAARAAVAS